MSVPLPQPHRILRQVIELSGCRRAEATSLQAAAGRRFSQQLLPVIERQCNALGDAAQVQRIDRLVIDLGRLPASAWLEDDAPSGDLASAADASLVGRFESRLARALTDALRTAPQVKVDLELVASYLRTGTLPWWADARDRSALRAALEALLAGPVAVWRHLLEGAGAATAGPRRLVAQLDDIQLARLAGRLIDDPGAQAWSHPAWSRTLTAAAATLRLAVPTLRSAWWCSVLAAARQPVAAAALWPVVLRRLSGQLGRPGAEVAQALRSALDQAMVATDAIALAPLWRAIDQAWPATEAAATAAATVVEEAVPDGGELALAAALVRLAAPGAEAWPWHTLARWLADQLATLPDGLQRSAQQAWAASPVDEAALRQALSALLQQAARQGLRPPGGADPAATDADSRGGDDAAGAADDAQAAPDTAAAALARALAGRRAAAPTAPAAMSDAPSALYLGNAGLVLLWPFIQRFADRLGLLEQGRWRSDEAAARTAVLLQCVATGDVEPPEFQLPLNKLLCGLALDHPVLLDQPLNSDEQAECETLLRAVIAAAPILREMSSAGFRSGFLQRDGQLSGRDGHWLLRVERRSHDVVIERFPWGLSLVRLPWMPALLQVDW